MENGQETRRERFVRIAERRVNRVLEGLDSLANCANSKNYEYSEDDVRKIFIEIERKLKETKTLFQAVGKGHRRFRLG